MDSSARHTDHGSECVALFPKSRIEYHGPIQLESFNHSDSASSGTRNCDSKAFRSTPHDRDDACIEVSPHPHAGGEHAYAKSDAQRSSIIRRELLSPSHHGSCDFKAFRIDDLNDVRRSENAVMEDSRADLCNSISERELTSRCQYI